MKFFKNENCNDDHRTKQLEKNKIKRERYTKEKTT
jgi:hypothetical protein